MAYEKQLIRFGAAGLESRRGFCRTRQSRACVSKGSRLEKLCRISKASEAVALADEVIVVLERCDEGSRQSGSLMKP